MSPLWGSNPGERWLERVTIGGSYPVGFQTIKLNTMPFPFIPYEANRSSSA
jgi:hypothetical protein